MYLAHDFQQELEQNFVVVQWDRRGAGKSFAGGLSGPEMTASREIEDTIELIDQLRSRLHQKKIYLVGFSYGSYLGILVAQRHPELLHAYIGIGQMACSDQESRTLQDTWIREQATQSADNDALDELNGRKPLDREKWLFKYGAEIHSARNWGPLLWSGLRSPQYTFQDVFNVKRGVDLTASKLRYDVITGSILENVSALQIPIYFFTGRFDYTDPTPCTVRLFDKIRAPAKKIIWFEHSAHFVFLDEPSRICRGNAARCPGNDVPITARRYGAGLNKIKGSPVASHMARSMSSQISRRPDGHRKSWPTRSSMTQASLHCPEPPSGTSARVIFTSAANTIENIEKALDRIDAWTRKNL